MIVSKSNQQHQRKYKCENFLFLPQKGATNVVAYICIIITFVILFVAKNTTENDKYSPKKDKLYNNFLKSMDEGMRSREQSNTEKNI